MEQLVRRKTALFCLVLVYSAFFAPYLSAVVRTILFCICAALTILFFCPLGQRIGRPVRTVGKCALLGVLCGLTLFSVYTEAYVGRIVNAGRDKEAAITAVIREKVYSYAYAAGYEAQIRTIGGEKASFSVLLESADTTLERGDVIACTAAFQEFREYSGAFAERKYYLSRGMLLRAETGYTARVGEASVGIRGFFSRLREEMSAILFVELGRDGAALPAALLLGDRSLLPDTLERDFRRLGISHMLAVSGLHFTLLLGMTERILRPVLRERKRRLLLLMVLSVILMLLCGMSESVVRAGLMYLTAAVAQLLGRKSDMLTTLGLCAAIMLIVQPASMYSVGFQLSVTAVIGIGIWDHVCRTLWAHKPCGRVRRIGREIAVSFGMSVVIQLLLLPLLCLYFGEVSLLTPLSNLLFTPFIQLILILSPFVIVFRGPSILVGFLAAVCEAVSSLAAFFAQPSGITVSLHYSFAPLFAAALAVLLLLVLFMRSRRAVCLVFLGSFALLLGYGGSVAVTEYVRGDEVRVISSVYNKNDALILRWRGKTLLCDVSDGSYTAISTAYAAAQENCATELDALMLTHLHSRHIRSFDRLSDTAYVRALILPRPVTADEASVAEALLTVADEKSIPVYLYDSGAGDSVQFGDAVFTLEDRIRLSRSTHPVLCLRMEAHGKSLLYLSSSWNEWEGAEEITTADAVILGAHGPVYKKTSDCPPAGTVILRGTSGYYVDVPEVLRAPVGAGQNCILLFRREKER